MDKKIFTFKLAERNRQAASKWMAGEGVSLAGRTHIGDVGYRFRDTGYCC